MFLKLKNLKLNLIHSSRIQIYDAQDGTGSFVIKMVDAQYPIVLIRKAPLDELIKLDAAINTAIDAGDAIMGVDIEYQPPPPDINQESESEQDRQFREWGLDKKATH